MIPDNAFYRRADCWIDSRLVNQQVERQEPARVIEFGSREFVELASSLVRQGRQASISLDGDILLEVHGEPILIKCDAPKSGEQLAQL